MSSLSLPKPVNSYGGEDELRKVNGHASTSTNGNGVAHSEPNGTAIPPPATPAEPERPSDRLKIGIIYPPKEIRSIVDKTALHISKVAAPLLLEEKIREHQKTDPKFAFLNDNDPYHKYYRWMLERIKEDVAAGVETGIGMPTQQKKQDVEVMDVLMDTYEPKPKEFLVDLPGVTAMDLDILRLTALFHARRGRAFLSALSVREGRNYQFDFLRPTHSLFGYYNRMVESYQKVMQPPPGQVAALVQDAADPQTKWNTLEDARKRAGFERHRREREDLRTAQKEEEGKAMAAIDWQDFVVVETIEFTQNDETLELPPPTSADKLRTMSMAEKRMASLVMEETGAGPTGGEANGLAAMEMEEEEEPEEVKLQRIRAEQEQARAREVQRAAMESRGMRIKKDYQTKVATAKCPYCGQSIPENELSEHIRIELLDPKWKEQKRVLDERRAQALQMQQGADVSASLRNLASARTDLFGDEIDEEERKRRDEAEKQKRREREKIIWDGHTNSAQKTETTFQQQFTLEDQIQKMHTRIGVNAAEASVGPQMPDGSAPSSTSSPAPYGLPNRAALPPALAAALPMPAGSGTAYPGSTISAEPTGPVTKEYITTEYTPAPAPPTSSGPSIHPSRVAAMSSTSSAPPPPVIGVTRPAPDDPEYQPPPQRFTYKRPRVEKLLYGQLYSEVDWISLHPDPIALSVLLPSVPDKPELKLDGSVIVVPDLPVNTLFSTLRERIKMVVDADLPISRMQLSYEGKTMNNKFSMASVNLDEGDMVTLTLKKK